MSCRLHHLRISSLLHSPPVPGLSPSGTRHVLPASPSPHILPPPFSSDPQESMELEQGHPLPAGSATQCTPTCPSVASTSSLCKCRRICSPPWEQSCCVWRLYTHGQP